MYVFNYFPTFVSSNKKFKGKIIVPKLHRIDSIRDVTLWEIVIDVMESYSRDLQGVVLILAINQPRSYLADFHNRWLTFPFGKADFPWRSFMLKLTFISERIFFLLLIYLRLHQ